MLRASRIEQPPVVHATPPPRLLTAFVRRTAEVQAIRDGRWMRAGSSQGR